MINYIQNIATDPNVQIFILSMLPVTELRLSIPYGILQLGMDWRIVFMISFLGNLIISIPILLFIGPASNFLRKKSAMFDKIFEWVFYRTLKKGKIIKRIQFWGLVLFIGIPLPTTGVWTGSVGAFLFNYNLKKSLLAISIALFMSASIVTALSLLSSSYIEHLKASL